MKNDKVDDQAVEVYEWNPESLFEPEKDAAYYHQRPDGEIFKLIAECPVPEDSSNGLWWFCEIGAANGACRLNIYNTSQVSTTIAGARELRAGAYKFLDPA